MSTTDLHADLIRRAEACQLSADTAEVDSWVGVATAAAANGSAAAYRHAAELLRGAVAAAVAEEREGCVLAVDAAADACGVVAWPFVDAIRARGESPRGDAASDGREGAE